MGMASGAAKTAGKIVFGVGSKKPAIYQLFGMDKNKPLMENLTNLF